MACVIRRSGHELLLWAREPEVVEAINDERVNTVFLPRVPLDSGIRATTDLGEATQGQDFIVMAVPAQHVRTVAGLMRPELRRLTPVVSCSKGIERGSCALMPEVLADMLPEAVVAVRQISSRHFCVHLSDDVIGAAIGGAMKNVISIASGIVAGRKLGENARATIITLGLAEATRLGLAKGAELQTFLGLAGAGDIMLTANSLQSRNTSLGVALGEGRSLHDVLAERKEVTEGAFSIEAVASLARQLHVDMPVTQALDALLNHGVDLEVAIAELFKHLPPLFHTGQRDQGRSG
jgi:glycerol-3-phosphate dehydrogenase (NAD(P)+)